MRARRRAGLFLAALALALQAFWPLIAQARPKNVVLVPVCTVEGVTHYTEVPGGQTPAEERTSKHGGHCDLCIFGGDKAVLAPTVALLAIAEAATAASPRPELRPIASNVTWHAQSRAPPFSLVVHAAIDEPRRNHEQATALRGSAPRGASEHRHRLVRLGLLHA